MMVGNIKCLFVSYFNNGRSPLLSIGPSWPFTIGLVTFAIVALVYFIWILSLLKNTSYYIKEIAYVLMLSNIVFLFTGILKNPGIP